MSFAGSVSSAVSLLAETQISDGFVARILIIFLFVGKLPVDLKPEIKFSAQNAL
jgi:hypothetical protein